ncbi:MAG: NUDIX hydrolase [Xylophilus ampelinus]
MTESTPTDRSPPSTAAGDTHLAEERLSREGLAEGSFLRVVRDTVRLPDGREATRELVLHPGAVMVVPLVETAAGPAVVLERQFRHPVGRVMVEFPAGKLDAGESVFRCAQRELREETGYAAREWARAGVLHPAIGYSDEFIEIWFARGLSLGERALDDGEFLDVFTAPVSELLAWCRDGRVTDGKTLSAALFLQNFVAGAWPLEWRDADALAAASAEAARP